MTTSQPSKQDRAWIHIQALAAKPAAVTWGAALLALVLFLSTLQVSISSGGSPYVTDVGEIQNALPRWGTLHFTGYALYSLTGSALVSLLCLFGIEPAAGSSLVSAVWGALAMGLLAALALEVGANRWAAVGASLLGAMSLSFWINGSLAEVHTMTMALTLASLLFALRYRRTGARSDLLWLAVGLSQGVAHQRAVALLAPAVAVLIWPHWREIVRNLLPILGIGVLAFLTYLYLPLRAWQGADWTFGQIGTWKGFWAMILDTKVTRAVALPADLPGWWEHGKNVLKIITADQPWPFVALGLVGLWLPARRRGGVVSLGLTLVWLVYCAIALVIWEGRTSDALLAVLLPVATMASLGLALLASAIMERGRLGRVAAPIALGGLVLLLGLINRPQVLAITRDQAIEGFIAQVTQADLPPGRPCTLLVPWGQDYWALRYVQAYQGQFKELRIVDHNADIREILAEGSSLLTPAKTFFALPLAWWEEQLGKVHLYSVGIGVVGVAASPRVESDLAALGEPFDLGNGIRVWGVKTTPVGESSRLLSVYWQAVDVIQQDYAVAVHILAGSSGGEAGAIISQADRSNPVEGLYPTSRWTVGEIVRDDYLLTVPAGSEPATISLAMYRQDADGKFLNTPWLDIPW